MKKCVVTGTFDPLTIGHENIINRALAMFDKVYVSLLVNPDKTPLYTVEQRLEMIHAVFGDAVEAAFYDGLAADFAKSVGADCLVRGVRGEADAAYEKAMADFNKALGVDTLLLPAEASLADVSATAVRENGRDDYVSEKVLKLINGFRRK